MKNESNTFVRRADARLFLSIVAAGLLSFTGVVIETAMNVTFPTLMEEFSISTSTVQWLTTGYLLVLALAVFGWQENLLQKVGVTPLLNLQVFQVPAFDGAVLGLLLIQFLCLGVGFLLPNYAQIVLGSDPFAAGCILLPGCLVGAALALCQGASMVWALGKNKCRVKSKEGRTGR